MKRPDFRTARELFSVPSGPIEGPKLSTLIRGRAIERTPDGSKVEVQLSWNGLVGRGSLSRPFPGRYIFDAAQRAWIWQPK